MSYTFKSTGVESTDKLIRIFDRQIKREWGAANKDKKQCLSYWNKLIFLESATIYILDWREIRTGNYWQIRDSLKGIGQSRFIYERIKEYKKLNHIK